MNHNPNFRGFIAPLLLILIAVIFVAGGAYVYEQQKQAAVGNSDSSATSTAQAANTASISSFKIEPSTMQTDGLAVYSPGARVFVIGEGLKSVTIKYRPDTVGAGSGAGADPTVSSTMTKVAGQDSIDGDRWEFVLPDYLEYSVVWIEAIDNTGKLVTKDGGRLISYSATIRAADSQTLDWKTYRNEEYGFEFKYPPQFYVVSEGFDAQTGILVSVALDDVKFKGQDRFRKFTTVSLSKNISLDNFINGLSGDVPGTKLNVTTRKKISDNPPIYKIYIGDSGLFEAVAVNGTTYARVASGSGPGVDQIISAFKFVR